MKRDKAQLIARLKGEGLCFREFTVTQEGGYSVSDADWNYKDVPHLHLVHEGVRAAIALVEDDKIATINLQKMLGLPLPLAVFNYESGPNSQTYYTTWLFFVLIIEVVYEALGENRTRVHTTYAVGSSRLLAWLFPVIRRVLVKNYHKLLSGDAPMRARRGQLRSWGYSFSNEASRFSYEKSMDFSGSYVVAPKEGVPFEPVTLSLDADLPDQKEIMVGRSDHMGLRLMRRGEEVAIYPRLCPHEGSNLDEARCMDKKLKCHWHGRVFGPLAVLDAGKPGLQRFSGENHEITLSNRVLTIKRKKA